MNKPWKDPMLAQASGFRTVADNLSYTVSSSEIEGEIPKDLRGIFLRAGPARNELGGKPFGHWFDGDGAVHALRIENGEVHYRSSFVKTPKYVDETAAQKIVYRSFGHNAPGGFLKNLHMPANVANTNVVYHGGKLLALFEGGRPWALDVDTLETLGEETFNNELGSLDTFSAHGKLDPVTGDYINFGMRPGLTGPRIELYRVSPEGKVIQRGSFKTDSLAFCHDCGFTENYLVFPVMPLAFKQAWRVMLALGTVDESMQFQPELGMKVYVVSLKDFKLVKTFEVEPFMYAHTSNCWEEENELVIDVDEIDLEESKLAAEFTRNLFTSYGPPTGELKRFRFDMATGGVKKESLPSAIPCAFPQWDWRNNGRETRFIYTAGICQNETPGFYNALQRTDLKTGDVQVYDCGAGRYTSEPIFVPESPESSEAEGYLLAAIYNASTELSELLILDAQNLSQVIAIVPLQNHIPHGFHCGFTALPN